MLGTGTQWGKTRVGGVRMKMKMHQYTDRSDNFLITAPTYKILSQSTLPAFLSFMEGFGKYNKKEDVFEMTRGGRAYFRTETDPDSIIGMTNVRHIWGDEAGKYRLYFWENLQARADFGGCGIDLTTSPYALNWIYKELIKPTRGNKRDDVELIQAASWENPFHSLHDPKRMAQVKASMDPRRFNMIYGGEWGRMEGLVYDCFDGDVNVIEPFHLPTGTKYVGGVDWGHTEPFVLVVRAITPGGMHYQVSEFYKSGLTFPEQLEIMKQKQKVFDIARFWCGHERPEHILEMNRNGLSAQAAEHYIRHGTDLQYEMIKTGRYKIFAGSSPYTLDEFDTYHYPEKDDLRPDQDAKELLPVGQNDHSMSANRFITLHEYRSNLRKLVPKAPEEGPPKQEDHVQRAKRLMKRSPYGKHTEEWS